MFQDVQCWKSSLINALLGDAYLVSSPNPTTAAMIELTYGEESQITLKSPEQILEELNQLFELENKTLIQLRHF